MGLAQFIDMATVYPVDPALISRTTKWLLSRRYFISNVYTNIYIHIFPFNYYLTNMLCDSPEMEMADSSVIQLGLILSEELLMMSPTRTSSGVSPMLKSRIWMLKSPSYMKRV